MRTLPWLGLLVGVVGACALPRSRAIELSAGDSSRGALPIRIVGDYLVADVSLDGRPPVRLMVDTGAGFCSIDPDLAQEMGWPKEADAVVQGWAGDVATTIVRGRSLVSGPLRVDGPLFAVVDRSALFSGEGEESRIRGILGLEVLRPFVVTIDFREPSLSIATRREAAPEETLYPMRQDPSGRYLVSVRILEEDTWLLVDTGANDSIAIAPPIARRIRADPDRGREIVGTAIGGTVRARVIGSIELKRGGKKISEPVIATDHLGGLDGRLGTGFLKHFRVTLDFPNEAMAVE